MSVSGLSSVSWRKSSFSDSDGENCVEIAAFAGSVAIRDSKNPNAALMVGRDVLGVLARGLKS